MALPAALSTGGGGVTGGEATSGADGYQDIGGIVHNMGSGTGGRVPPPWPFDPDLGVSQQTAGKLVWAGAVVAVVGLIAWVASRRR